MDIATAKKIMGKNFIGPVELGLISALMGIIDPVKTGATMPKISFDEKLLEKHSHSAVLILGMPKLKNGKTLTINALRSRFGWDPNKSEPCFYNQDWYVAEKFADKTGLKFKWYLLEKNIKTKTRGQSPPSINKELAHGQKFPAAVLVAFAFFAYYFHTKGEILWPHDFVWCSDNDKNGDQIYVGRYSDLRGINKNGFNIHRHLKIRNYYGLAPQII